MVQTLMSTPSVNPPTLTALTALHQAQIAQQHTPFTLRIHRALSWLQRAEAAREGDDVVFACHRAGDSHVNRYP